MTSQIQLITNDNELEKICQEFFPTGQVSTCKVSTCKASTGQVKAAVVLKREPFGLNEIYTRLESCFPETISSNRVAISFQNGIIKDCDENYCYICVMGVKSSTSISKYTSFKLKLDTGLVNKYIEGNVDALTENNKPSFGEFLSNLYSVTSDNWMENYRFGGINKYDQVRHTCAQFLLQNEMVSFVDFPKKGVVFQDMIEILVDSNKFNLLVEQFSSMILRNFQDFDLIAGLESRGYYLATILANKFKKGFLPIRKANKLPPSNTSLVKYKTEYSEDSIGIIQSPNYKNKKILIIDDLFATGGSMMAAKQLLTNNGMQVLGGACITNVPEIYQKNASFKCSILINSHDDKFIPNPLINETEFNTTITPKNTNCKIIPCFGAANLAESISNWSGIPICKTILQHFNNGETRVEIQESVRDMHIIVVCPTNNGTLNDDFLSMRMVLDALQRSGVSKKSVILPYYPYGRSDKKDSPRTHIGSAVIANILKSAKVDNIISLDLHAGQTQGLIDEGFHNIYMLNTFCEYIKSNILFKYVLISPDAGSNKRIESYAKKLNMPHCYMHKHRSYEKPGVIEEKSIFIGSGEFTNSYAVIIDDMVDTMGTINAACSTLIDKGFIGVIVIATHGVLSGPAIERINRNEFIKQVVVANTLEQRQNLMKCDKLRVVDCSSLLSKVLLAITSGGSVSDLFK